MKPYTVQTLDIAAKATKRNTASKYPFREMGVGDMFFAPSKKGGFYAQVSRVGTQLKRKFTCRHLMLVQDTAAAGTWRYPEDGEEGVSGMGVWRVE